MVAMSLAALCWTPVLIILDTHVQYSLEEKERVSTSSAIKSRDYETYFLEMIVLEELPAKRCC